MISILLLIKILQLSLFLVLGYILIKIKFFRPGDSLLLSKICLFLFLPSAIFNAFDIQLTHEITRGLLVGVIAAILVHLVFLGIGLLYKKIWGATCVERDSVIYSNAGNMVLPIVASVLGEEWVVYTSSYICVQILFLWTHGVSLFSKDRKIHWKKILLNINILAVFAGLLLLFSGRQLPGFVKDFVSPLANMVGPAGMLVAGMTAAEAGIKKMFTNKRAYGAVLMRLLLCPALTLILFKIFSTFASFPNADKILLISYLACISPTAATIMQLAQLHQTQVEDAVSINILTTVGCIVTMPLFVALF